LVAGTVFFGGWHRFFLAVVEGQDEREFFLRDSRVAEPGSRPFHLRTTANGGPCLGSRNDHRPAPVTTPHRTSAIRGTSFL
jgi:hypothetical protein